MVQQTIDTPTYKTPRTKCPLCEHTSLYEDSPYSLRQVGCGSCGFEWFEVIESDDQPDTDKGEV